MLTHLHMVVYTWWCWHICKGEGVGVDFVQLGEEREVFGCSLDIRMAFRLEYWFDSFLFGLSIHIDWISL